MIIIKVTKIKIDKIVLFLYFVPEMGLIHLFMFISNFSKSYISVLESFTFQETATLFPGEV